MLRWSQMRAAYTNDITAIGTSAALSRLNQRFTGLRTVATQRRWMFIALAVSIALHGVALVGTSRLDFAWLYADRAAQLLQVEIVAPPPVQSVPQAVRKPKARKASTQPRAVPPQPPRNVSGKVESESPAAGVAVAQPLDEGDSAAHVVASETANEEPVERAPLVYPVRSARLVFDLYYGDSKTLIGEVVQTWQLEGDHYIAESSAEAVGLVSLFLGGRYVQRSEGSLGPDGFVPRVYTSQDRRREQPERAIFDWDAGMVRFHRREKERQAELKPGTQDPLSAVHQLLFLRPLAPGLLMNVATTRKVETMLFQNMGVDEVMTASGPVIAAHVKRQDLDGAITEVWLDPQRSFLPVRIYTLNRNGYMLDQILREASVVPIGVLESSDATPAD